MDVEKNTVIDQIILGMQDITRVLWAAAALLAPWIVPVGSAIFFGLAMYNVAIQLNAPQWLAYVVGVSVAVGLETVNIGTAHSAMALSHRREDHKGKFALAVLLMVFYVGLGIGATFTLPLDTPTHILAASLFFLTPVAILAQALTLDLATTTKRSVEVAKVEAEVEAEDREYRRQLEREKLEMEHEERMKAAELDAQYRQSLAQARWNAKARIAQVSAQASSNRSVGAQMSDHNGRERPEWADRWATPAAFMLDVVQDPELCEAVSGMSGADFARLTGKPESTARRWVSDAKEAMSTNGHSENTAQ